MMIEQTEPNKIGAANVRPASPFRVLRDFGRELCAQPFRSAHVAELGRWTPER